MNGYTKIITAIGAVISVIGAVIFTAPSSYAYETSATVNDLTFSFDGSIRTVKQGGGYIIDVPLYLTTSFNRDGYLSGLVYFPKPSISFRDSTGANLVITSFIPFAEQGITFTWAQGTNVFMYFDNVNFTGNGNKVYLGSFRFEFTNANDITNVLPTPSTFTVTPFAEGLTSSSAPLGFETAFINAINSATDIDSIVTLLTSINSLSVDLSSKLTTNNNYIVSIDMMLSQRLPSILTSLNNSELYLSRLIYALVGANNSTTDFSATTYERWVNIIFDALNKNNPSDTGSTSANDISVGLGNLSNGMEVQKPDNFADVSDNLLSQYDTSFNTSAFAWTNNSIIIMMLSTVIAIAGLSYLLYGKK